MGLYDSNSDTSEGATRNQNNLGLIVIIGIIVILMASIYYFLKHKESRTNYDNLIAHEKMNAPEIVDKNRSSNELFMNGKYKLSHQISSSTTDADELLMLNDTENQLTPKNERQFWAAENWIDNIVRSSRDDVYLIAWEGDLLDALNRADEIRFKLVSSRFQELGPPLYWLAVPKIYYNMSGRFRIGVMFKMDTPEYNSTFNKVNLMFPELKKHNQFEPVVEFSSFSAQNLIAIRGLPDNYFYLK